ncbi:MAG: hypothetical protein H7256_13375 [Bdellovibrio sp.]|nr:hypothetical protein [Bdellovibrio sp.]
MPIVFSILLFCNAVFAAESVSQQTYTHLNKPFQLDRRLKSKVATVGTESKIIDFARTSDLSKQNAKVEKAFEVLKKEFLTELEKKFTKEEISYLNKMFSHSLMNRLVEFQNEFADSDKYNKLIQETLKKDSPAAIK